MSLQRWLRLPAKFRFIEKYLGQQPFRLLDIGAGNHSASKTIKWYPHCEYYGIDKENYNNDDQDFRLMRDFYQLNLEELQFESVPDNYFDFIMMAHVVEHLQHGEAVIEGLLPKLKKGGMIYIEFPNHHSASLPSMKSGTLNFYDDPTHVRIYDIKSLSELLVKNQLAIISMGRRKYLPELLLTPVKIPHNLIKYGKVLPSIYWDLLGFADYVFARQ